MKGFRPKIMPRFGRIDDIIKNPIPIKTPTIIRLLVWVDLNLPNINGRAKNNIITAENG